MPDGLRGKWKYSDKNWVKKYILQVQIIVDKLYQNNKIILFFC